jgi:hypothetical protein
LLSVSSSSLSQKRFPPAVVVKGWPSAAPHNRLAVVAAIFGSNGIVQRQLPTLQSKWTIPHPQCQHEPMDTPSTAQLARSSMVVPVVVVLHVDLMSSVLLTGKAKKRSKRGGQ